MSVTRKIVDGAVSGLNSLLGKISADDTPLSHVDSAALDAELERRVAHQKQRPNTPDDNPRAALAGAGEAAENKRKALAKERERRVHGERDAKRAAEKAASDEAFRRMKEQAGDYDFSSSASSGSSRPSSSSGSSQRPRMPRRKSDAIAKHYKTLDVPYGAGFDEVKSAYRKLMRKYHPDLHRDSEAKQKAATELTLQVTAAYDALDEHLNGPPNKGS